MEATAESHDLARRICAQSKDRQSAHRSNRRARAGAAIRLHPPRPPVVAARDWRRATARRKASALGWATAGRLVGGSATPAAEAEMSAAHGPIGDMAKRVRGDRGRRGAGSRQGTAVRCTGCEKQPRPLDRVADSHDRAPVLSAHRLVLLQVLQL